MICSKSLSWRTRYGMHLWNYEKLYKWCHKNSQMCKRLSKINQSSRTHRQQRETSKSIGNSQKDNTQSKTESLHNDNPQICNFISLLISLLFSVQKLQWMRDGIKEQAKDTDFWLMSLRRNSIVFHRSSFFHLKLSLMYELWKKKPQKDRFFRTSVWLLFTQAAVHCALKTVIFYNVK